MDQQQAAPNSRRLMQVKVLYTFNDENKSNCLARCQQPLSIQTATLDSSTEIGIIELRTCIQAIVSASPELVAKLGQDYTIYAYDYSEYETPLVGQGMLSWVLASSSSTPTAPADQSRTMVTGRVCKNVLALFSEGAKETLEVKLRLVPVPTCLQSEYLASMEKYRNTSTVVNQNFDTAAWSTFLHANPNFGAVDSMPQPTNFYAPQPQYATHASSDFDPTFHTLQVGPTTQQQAGSSSWTNKPSSRPTTPSESRSQARKRNPPSRPSSRAYGRSRPSLKKTASCVSRVETNQAADTSEAEEGPSRKRARVTKADWNGSSTFGANAESLRVTAATAASIRGSRPFNPSFPSASDIAAGEVGERPPTPRPNTAKSSMPVPIPRSLNPGAGDGNNKSNKRATSNPLDVLHSYESSPEKQDDSSASTPWEFPSSPPVMQPPSPTPSSPPLPRLPGHQDSGFVSGTIEEDLFGDSEAQQPIEIPHQYKKHVLIKSEAVSSEPSLGKDDTSGNQHPEQQQSQNDSSKTQDRSQAVNSRSSPAPRSRSQNPDVTAQSPLALPAATETEIDHMQTNVAGDQVEKNEVNEQDGLPTSIEPANLTRQRSESCAVDTTSYGTPPEMNKDTGQSKPRQNSVMHEKKKKAIQDHLAQAIKSGQMPRYCKNCGAISTPTWRIAFVKVEQGPPDNLQLSENDNGILTWEALEKGDDGKILSYRIIKKTIAPDEAGFESLDLCNSCGVWLFKNKCMRPPEVWDKGDGPKPPPKPRPRKPKKKPDGGVPASDAQSEPNLEPQTSNTSASGSGAQHKAQNAESSEDSSSKEKDRSERANSVGSQDVPMPAAPLLEKSAAAAALRRAIQSSPPRFPGSKFSPIDIDATKVSPQPTRRLLFPSPRKPGEIKSLDGSSATNTTQKEKENATPKSNDNDDDDDDGLNHLFEKGDASKSMDRTRQSLTPRDPLKTPSRKSGSGGSIRKSGHLTSAAKRWRSSNPSTPSRGIDNDFELGLEQMTPFTRQLTQLISEANQSSEDNDPTFDPMNPNIDVPGVFTFSDFSAEELGIGADGSTSGFFGTYDDQGASSEGIWDGNQDMNEAIDAFLEMERSEEDATSSVPA